MFSFIKKIQDKTKSKKAAIIFVALLFANVKSVWADGPPLKSSMSNPIVIMLVFFIVVLAIIIAVLSKMLISAGRIKFKKWKDTQNKKASTSVQAAAAVAGLLLLSLPVFSQTTDVAKPTGFIAESLADLSPTTFYMLLALISFELLVIVVLLFNTRSLLKAEEAEVLGTIKKNKLEWWDKLNKFRPQEQEAEIDLGHNYDGIRELDNRLPPWWLYGFYITIVFGVIYLYRYHVAHSAPLSHEEYTIAVEKADAEVKAYLKQKGDAVDENTVTMLGKEDIDAAKTLFQTSCVTCHNQGGAGNIGPNLTDDYWLHGGDIKSVFKTIKYGINAMPSWQATYSNKQIAQLASYVKSLRGTNPPNPKAAQGELYKEDSLKTDSSAVKKVAMVEQK